MWNQTKFLNIVALFQNSILSGYALFFVFILVTIGANSQKPGTFAREISLSSANDDYIIWQNSDRFYSYGAGVNLKFKSKELLGLHKLFSEKTDYFYDVGLRIEGFTPTNKTASSVEIKQNIFSFDRPFAGLLFGTFSVNYAFEKSFLRIEALLGIMGPSSLSGNLQNWFHEKVTNDPIFDEWRFQVPNQLILNMNVTYAHDFMPQQKWFDIYGMGNTRLGNLYIDVTPILGLRLGKFNKLTESVGMDANILSNSHQMELFFQSTISGSVNIFDSTAQGNFFSSDFEYAVDKLNRFSSKLTQSIYFSSRRFSLGIEHHLTFGKVVSNERHAYGRAILKYKF